MSQPARQDLSFRPTIKTKAIRFRSTGTSVTRANNEVLTPTAGYKIHVVSASLDDDNATAGNYAAELYFGTGATYDTDTSKAVALEGFDQNMVPGSVPPAHWGAYGPTGQADEVLSCRTTVDLGAPALGLVYWTVHYFETDVNGIPN